VVTPARRTVDVVIPAGGDAASVRRCIERVLASRNATAFAVQVMMDADGDAGLTPSDPRIAFERSREGDAATRINRAIAAHADRDIVLLQPSAEVAGDWLDRLAAHGIDSTTVNKVAEGRPHVVDMIKNGEIAFIVNTVEDSRTAQADSRSIRVTALSQRVTYYTTIAGARAACNGMRALAQLRPYRLQELHAQLR